MINKIGVSRRVYTEGKNKAILDPFLPEAQENVEILKNAQRDIFENFKDLVRSRRSEKLKDAEDNLFNGAFWSGKKAAELGLVDEISDLRSKMKEKFGKKVQLLQITSKKGFLKSLFSEKNNQIDRLFSKLEERLSFNKFGL